MKKKMIAAMLITVCTVICAVFFSACGKELNYLKADDGSGKLKTEFDFGNFSVDELDKVKTKLSGLTFYYEYFPDNSTEEADMSEVKVKHFVSGTNGKEEHAGLPETLQASSSYTVCYYYTGHEPTADASDSFVVTISFWVNE